ncbi:MAG: MoaD/ThiS family protein [Promethearchaeota archaeon]
MSMLDVPGNMITISVHFYSYLEDIIGLQQLNIHLKRDSMLSHLLKILQKELGHNFTRAILEYQNRVNKYIIISVNGIEVKSLDKYDLILKNEDEVSFLPAIAGG